MDTSNYPTSAQIRVDARQLDVLLAARAFFSLTHTTRTHTTYLPILDPFPQHAMCFFLTHFLRLIFINKNTAMINANYIDYHVVSH